MTTRPTDTPRWATSPADPNVDPGDAKRAAGYVPSEQPPAQEFNWMDNLVGEWVDYLRELNVSNWFLRAHDSATTVSLWAGVAVDPTTGVMVVVGQNAAGDPRINYSAYGQKWVDATSTFSLGSYLDRVCFARGPALFVACGGQDDVETSPDGATWTLRIINGPTPNRDLDDNGQTGASAEIMGVGGANEYIRSTDGVTWSFGTINAGANTPRGIAHNKRSGALGLWVIVGDGGDIWTSPGGATPTWTQRTDPTGGQNLRSVVWDEKNQYWIAVGDTALIRSADGVTWAVASSTPPTVVFGDVHVSPDGIALAVADPATNDQLRILMSKDGGDTWEEKTQEFGRRYFAVHYDPRRDWTIVGTDHAGTDAIIMAGLRSGTVV